MKIKLLSIMSATIIRILLFSATRRLGAEKPRTASKGFAAGESVFVNLGMVLLAEYHAKVDDGFVSLARG